MSYKKNPNNPTKAPKAHGLEMLVNEVIVRSLIDPKKFWGESESPPRDAFHADGLSSIPRHVALGKSVWLHPTQSWEVPALGTAWSPLCSSGCQPCRVLSVTCALVAASWQPLFCTGRFGRAVNRMCPWLSLLLNAPCVCVWAQLWYFCFVFFFSPTIASSAE